VRVDGSHLPEHPARAHNNERRLGQEDARPEVQFPGHGRLESVAGEGAGHSGLWRRRVPQHDLRGERSREQSRDPAAGHGFRGQSNTSGSYRVSLRPPYALATSTRALTIPRSHDPTNTTTIPRRHHDNTTRPSVSWARARLLAPASLAAPRPPKLCHPFLLAHPPPSLHHLRLLLLHLSPADSPGR
jgi:hypothetical protein